MEKEKIEISAQIILKFKDKFVALRRPEGVPGLELPKKAENYPFPLLYFIHGVPNWGETTNEFINRICSIQAGIKKIKECKIAELNMYKENNIWKIKQLYIVELSILPQPGIYGNLIVEVVKFGYLRIQDEYGFWEKEDLRHFIKKHSR